MHLPDQRDTVHPAGTNPFSSPRPIMTHLVVAHVRVPADPRAAAELCRLLQVDARLPEYPIGARDGGEPVTLCAAPHSPVAVV